MTHTKHVFNNTTKISYTKAGDGQALILLHGNSQSNKLYAKVIPQLVTDGYAVFAIDSRGHGKSGRVKLLRYIDMADDVYAVVKQESLVDPIVFGFSDGGVVGLMFAMKYPDALKKLVACSIRLSLKGVVLWMKLFWRIVYFFTRMPRLKLLLSQPEITAAELAKIKAPTVIVHAEHDLVKLSHSFTAAESIPNCELIQLPKETHSSYVRKPKKLLKLLAEVLSCEHVSKNEY